MESAEKVTKIAKLIAENKKIIVFTGAGISTESGIPDFRGPDGLWKKFDPEDFTYNRFVSNKEARKRLWQLSSQLDSGAEPNKAHYAITELDRMGRLDCVVTQNVDRLHQQAGIDEKKVFELHGNFKSAICLDCGFKISIEKIRKRLDGGEEDLRCESCGGILKPAAIFFGEPLPQEVFREAAARASDCELLISIGSTLSVYPAAEIPSLAKAAGARLVIVNMGGTHMDRQADVVLEAMAGEVMPGIAEQVKVILKEKN